MFSSQSFRHFRTHKRKLLKDLNGATKWKIAFNVPENPENRRENVLGEEFL
jgi:hypothetical protein